MTSLGPQMRPARPGRGLRSYLLLVAVVGMLLFLFFPSLAGMVRADALPGVTVLGTEVGGLRDQELHDAVTSIAAARAEEPITLRRELPSERSTGEAVELMVPTGDLGYVMDVDATVAAVRARGRQFHLIAAWRDHLRSLAGATDGSMAVEPAEGVDDGALRAWAEEAASTLELEPIEGDVVVDGTTVVRTDPEPGVTVDADRLAAEARTVALEPGPATITTDNRTVSPETTRAAIDEAVALAERVISGPVVVSRDEGTLELDPVDLGTLVTFEQEGEELVARMSSEDLEAMVPDEVRAAFESDPVDAEITLDDGEIHISESEEGFRFDPGTAAGQVLELASGAGERTATLEGEIIAPSRSTSDAEDLEITEEVSSFTTEFVAGQSRVVNIHRIADLVAGVVLEPGETFSVNDHVGERTEERGFVGGGAILDGEFVEQIGGGVSQFATTMYNAVYFGGYEILDHQAHSYYISRYPAGREATLNYPNIDLEFRNNSPYGLLIDTSHTGSSVTVSIWGTEWVEVDSIAGDRTRIRSGQVRDGFDIVVTRVLTFPDGREEREEQFTRYLPEN